MALKIAVKKASLSAQSVASACSILKDMFLALIDTPSGVLEEDGNAVMTKPYVDRYLTQLYWKIYPIKGYFTPM